ncbi:hypothetical protein TIFTF001_023117 [Ficus carica]|uniref:Uncharacterized protein n=1 Tax=Ficus carica TaxID=3494 RepID=A0AA88AL94_FICCA|nr:hypothetical protein TIFTF001_023117 [Ficus carica]
MVELGRSGPLIPNPLPPTTTNQPTTRPSTPRDDEPPPRIPAPPTTVNHHLVTHRPPVTATHPIRQSPHSPTLQNATQPPHPLSSLWLPTHILFSPESGVFFPPEFGFLFCFGTGIWV